MNTKNKIELLAPAGDMEKLKTALYFGADAVYLGGKQFGLRAFSGNFDHDQMRQASELVHQKGKKLYVTLNIFMRDTDFDHLLEYLRFLEEIKIDAVIASDIGLIDYIRKNTTLKIHLSTQANALNSKTVAFYSQFVERVVLARELNLNEIALIHKNVPQCEIETFVHGAMCISYSGRCLISDYLSGRQSNRGECAQNCRHEYGLVHRQTGEDLTILEDSRGSYILNSKDLNMLAHVGELIEAGVTSFKIEGRAKSVYYCAGVVNAYRRAIDAYFDGRNHKSDPQSDPQYDLQSDPQSDLQYDLQGELEKVSHRSYTNGFYFSSPEQNHLTSRAEQSYEFIAVVKGVRDGGAIVEHRNRFKIGEELEVLSPTDTFLRTIKLEKMFDLDGNPITDANRVQQQIFIPTDLALNAGDILRRKN